MVMENKDEMSILSSDFSKDSLTSNLTSRNSVQTQRGESSLSAPVNPYDNANERTPLLYSQAQRDGTNSEAPLAIADAHSHENESKSTWYLILLTISMLGLQIMWTAELGQGTPYLVSLGMSKSLTAFVWIAGPLSGMLVQPYVGIRSDNCRISWGRRKPFMIGGAAATILSVMLLVWARTIVSSILSLWRVSPDSKAVTVSSIAFATASMYLLDFSINTLQASIRAFIVDNVPTHQQEDANAWASRLSGIGNVIGYSFGYVNLVQLMPFFGNLQVRIIGVIASLFVTFTLLLSCVCIQERNPADFGPPSSSDYGLSSFFKTIFRASTRMPPQVKRVCVVQFFNWIGWFPFLFYFTQYVGQLYANPIFRANPNMTRTEILEVLREGTRVGNSAFLVYSFTSLSSSIIFPFLIIPAFKPPSEERGGDALLTPHQNAALAAIEGSTFVPPDTSRDDVAPGETKVKQNKRYLTHLRIPGFSLRRAWLLSHVLFAISMFLTFFVQKPQHAYVLAALLGMAWCTTTWAPYAILAGEMARRDADRRQRDVTSEANRKGIANAGEPTNISPPLAPRPWEIPIGDAQSSRVEDSSIPLETPNTIEDESEAQAGVVLGLMNIAICVPQVLATCIGAVIFHFRQQPFGKSGDDSIAWFMRAGGLAALGAAVAAKSIFETADVKPFEETWTGLTWYKIGGARAENSVRFLARCLWRPVFWAFTRLWRASLTVLQLFDFHKRKDSDADGV